MLGSVWWTGDKVWVGGGKEGGEGIPVGQPCRLHFTRRITDHTAMFKFIVIFYSLSLSGVVRDDPRWLGRCPVSFKTLCYNLKLFICLTFKMVNMLDVVTRSFSFSLWATWSSKLAVILVLGCGVVILEFSCCHD